MSAIKTELEALCERRDLSAETCAKLFGRLIAGELNDIEISALLIAFKAKGEAPPEIAGAAGALRAAATPFPNPGFGVADSCGTGGDGLGTVNISTAAALIAAEAGLPVAKHGNRSISSRCGSADVLEACGVNLEASPQQSLECLTRERFGFLFAPRYHAGMRHVMPTRRALATRTLFNLLGPLANPSAPRWQLLGVYDPELCQPMAETLSLMGCEAALVVHGGGLDELALHAQTQCSLWRDGRLEELILEPEDVGFKRHPLTSIAGRGPEHNGLWLKELLGGRAPEAHIEAVAFNAGALLWISGQASDIASGCRRAVEVIEQGGAEARLARVAEVSRGA